MVLMYSNVDFNLYNFQEVKSSVDPERKVSNYMNICEHFKPVFRHFFFENFKEAGVFFEKRLAYTRRSANNCRKHCEIIR